MSIVRKARECLSEGHPSSQFQASINVLSAIVTATSLGFALYDLSAKAALVSLIAPVPTALAYAWYGRQEAKYWPLAAESNRRAMYLQDQFSYRQTGAELSLMNATSTLAKGAIRSRREFRRIREKLEGKSVMTDSVAGAATTILFIIALVFLYREAEHSVGAVFAGIVGLMTGISAMAGVGYQVGELAISMPANSHFRSLLKLQQTDGRRFQQVAMERLAVRDVDVSYGDVRAVKAASFEAQRGSLCAVVGENGSGKTSLIRALEGVQREGSGEVCVDGRTLDIAEAGDWFEFATVQQDYGRYELTVREFISLGVPAARVTDDAIRAALRFSEAEEFVDALPDGVDSALGGQWGGAELSGGQWQRLAIARAVLTDAPVWFLDEPTSAVDAPTEERIFDRLAAEAEKRVIILTSHRVSTLRAAENIVVLKDGAVCETGSYAELMTEGTEFHRMFSSQLEKA
ncbi:ABC transporter ATP-binding protein [Nanchangia anserum]|uniref:ATP-binding cassette domain-containing protein n=1 Tax=Nanchangia anserum TaxID=2692125 RepID=UPI00188312CE|nr:ABC transporter ATP-binding protein [Nanchangia anserum]QOX81672.1 ABC transporter ATP-binding protein [Nanchangia anserum]